MPENKNESYDDVERRVLDEVAWNSDSFMQLEVLGEMLALDLYPDSIAPLIETNDMVGKWLHNPMPYTATAALPYMSLCTHKYPPFEIRVASDLLKKPLQAYIGKESFEINLDLGKYGDLKSTIFGALLEKYQPGHAKVNERDDFIDKLDLVDALLEIIDNLKLSEDRSLNMRYLARIYDWAKGREEQLENRLGEIASNDMFQYLTGLECFDEAFKLFYQPLCHKSVNQYADLARQTVKYRFLLHIIVIFQASAGFAMSDDYTLPCLKQHQNKVDYESELFKEYRVALKSLSVNHTLPDKEDLDSIRLHAKGLLNKLYGRTNDHDLLMKLEKISRSEKNDFSMHGVLTNRTNMDVRAFIKAIASFCCLHDFDLIFLCRRVFDDKDYEGFSQSYSERINMVVEKLCDAFYLGFGKERRRNKVGVLPIVSNNTREVFDETFNQVEKYVQLEVVNSKLQFFGADFEFINDTFDRAYSGLKFDNDTLSRIKERIEPLATLEEKVRICGAFLIGGSEMEFWNEPFVYAGEVSPISGRVSLFRFELREIPPIILDKALYEIKQGLLQQKNKMCDFF